MYVDPCKRNDELPESVEICLLRAPVEAVAPVREQLL